MKPVEEFLFDLCNLEIKLWPDGESLRYTALNGTLTPMLKAEIAERKAEILNFLNKANNPSPSLIQVTPRHREMPLSFAQQRLWFLNQLEPNSAAYNMPGAVRLQGQLDITALEKTFNEIIRRHEVLRTNFFDLEGQSVARIRAAENAHLTLIDISDLEHQTAEIAALVEAEGQKPFDLAHDLLIRTTLLKITDTEHILLLTMHHIVSDGWSLEILVREITTLYAAFVNSEPSPLPELEIQYVDFAVWQKQWLQGETLERQLKYWQKQLADAPVRLDLPTDRPRPPVQTFNGADAEFVIPAQVAEKLHHLSQQEGVTLFMTLLTAFNILLYRHTGQTDILVGSPIANRNRSEIQELIGFFVNILVLRNDLSGNPTFRELLCQVREVALRAYDRQDLPFEMLIEVLQPERNPSHSPLFQVMFSLENVLTDEIDLPNLKLQLTELNTSTAKFDLTLNLIQTKAGLVSKWKYNTDLFDASTIERMSDHFQMLLAGITTNPDRHISTLPILTDTEQQQLLFDWNNTQTDYPQDLCIQQLFEQQVEKTPDAVAIVYKDEQLTYQELNQRANQLAHHLVSLGVKAETLVGLYVERSFYTMIGILGILKAGGAYVPLDANYPAERLAYMVSDSQMRVLLTTENLMAGLLTTDSLVICLDKHWHEIALQAEHNPTREVTSHNLVYVMYTSGSTGQPKGVMITHQGLVNYLSWCTQAYAVEKGDGSPVSTSIGFDGTITSLYPPLLVGKKVVLLPEDIEIEALRGILSSNNNFSLVKLTPIHLELLNQLLASEREQGQTKSLVIGGESLLEKSLSFWRTYSPNTKLINQYGPTETVVARCFYEVPPQVSRSGKVPIGRPIANTEIYLLDNHLQLVPIGVAGEIHIGGVGMARGYLHRPELTAEKFIAHPFSEDPQARLYKTGDLARYLPDGNIEYLGRIDHQVKIRGFRIELEEVESVISQHPQVSQVTVIDREDKPGTKQLVAYVVPLPEREPSSAEIRTFLKGKLPDYMLPAAIVCLAELPLTPNGKVDRQALPLPDFSQSQNSKYVIARNALEATLVEIWTGVLGVSPIGIHDNFFALGGDSIVSIQMTAKANQAGIQITPKQLFERQTIAELALVAETSTQEIIADQKLVCGQVLLTPIQKWFFAQNLTNTHHFNQSILLTIPTALTPALLEKVGSELLVHHDALRSRFIQTDGQWQQLQSESLPVNICSDIDLADIPVSEQSERIEEIADRIQASLSLADGELVRFVCFTLGHHQPNRLLIVIHHLVVDGISWRILLEDLQTIYQQLSNNQPVQLPRKTTSFQQWAAKLQAYAQSELLTSERDYWLGAKYKDLPQLPVDATGRNDVESSRDITVTLTPSETQALLQQVPQAYNTQINDVLLTALAQVLSKWLNSDVVSIDLEGHGREDLFVDVDISRTVGWFTTMFPVVLNLPMATTVGDAIKTVKEQLRQIPQKGLGYGLLRYLRQEQKLGSELQTFPQPEISFNYLGQFDQTFDSDSPTKLATESSGLEQSLQAQRFHLIDIGGIISDGQLQITWTYSQNIHQPETIERLATEYIVALRESIDHCLKPDVGSYTPSDFPLANIEQSQIDRLLLNQGSVGFKNIEDIYPLSPMQQGMLFHSLYAPESGVYVEIMSYQLQGDLNIVAFEQAWQVLLARHSIFRTAFIWEELEQPLQVVYRQVPILIQVEDWQHIDEVRGSPAFARQGLSDPAQRSDVLESFLQSQQQQGFQLSAAPLMRLYLMKLTDDEYQFVWVFHHLLLDGWSLPIVFRELLDEYEALCQGKSRNAPYTSPYRDYIAWLMQQDRSQAEKFWQQVLHEFTTPISLKSLLQNDVPKKTLGYRDEESLLPSDLTGAMESFAKQHQLTVNTLVQGAWAILLSRYSGEPDIVFGATVSGRPPALSGMESIIGPFINTLPVRMSIAADDLVLPWLQQLQSQQIDYGQFSYTSLVDIQNWSALSNGVSLFDHIVVFENYPVSQVVDKHHGSLQISDLEGMAQTNYPLTLVVMPGEQLGLKASYDTSLFDLATIERLLGHVQTLVTSMVTNPDRSIASLPMLTATEQQQILWNGNDTQTDYAQNICVHQLFEQRVQQTPTAIAVVCKDEQLTYQELNHRANQLARYLQQEQIESPAIVGICVERSIDTIVSILAVWKVGAAYVPLDPTYPPERLQFMLADASVDLILIQPHLAAELSLQAKKLINLEPTFWSQLAQISADNLNLAILPSNLANIIYTSGSTGKPKGVMVPHQGLCNLAQAQIELFQVQSNSRVLQFASFSFDASIWEIIMALGSGATLYVDRKEALLPGDALYEYLKIQEITHVTLPPTALAVLPVKPLPQLSTLIVAGEACSPGLIQQWSTGRSFFNAYGPTEGTVCATVSEPLEGDGTQVVPIGKPIPNVQVYILNEQLQPLPLGIVGELHISGAGIARGYLNRPELTAEKFIAHPFIDDREARLYKTGDLARYLPDGNIEYLGRIDQQVKIRGFRIELGEVEAAICQHPQVAQATVIDAPEERLHQREDIPGNKQLVAYVVPSSGEKVSSTEIGTYLKDKLPNYMVPTAVVSLAKLPLTPNGKVDRKALPIPDSNSFSSRTNFVPPLDFIEQQLTEIWSSVLSVFPIGRDDNFFELGGHSLLLMQLMAQIQQKFNQQLPLSVLFEHSNIRQLAELIRQSLNSIDWSGVVPIRKSGTNPPFFCVPGTGGDPTYLYNLAHYLDADQPFYGFQARGLDGQSNPHHCLEDMANDYIHSMRSVQPQGPYFLGGHSLGGLVAFEMANQLNQQGETVALLAILDTKTPEVESPEMQIKISKLNERSGGDWIIDAAQLLSEIAGQQLELDNDVLQGLDSDAQLQYFYNCLQAADMLLPGTNTTQLHGLIQVHKTQMSMFNQPKTIYPHQITCFVASGNKEENIPQPNDLGWKKLSDRPIERHIVPGNHTSMLEPPSVQTLAAKLQSCIKDRLQS
jgi:amino acid adenylation domain-containing protein/non-ribosomal peptide synthase protein (TIGR01720 family)